MPRPIERAALARPLPSPDTPYVRRDVVERLRAFLASGGSYHRDVTPEIAAAILAESTRG